MSIVIHFDGSYKAQRGNCSCGGWISRNGQEIGQLRTTDIACSSPVEAEYRALIMMLILADQMGFASGELEVRGDNQVCISQMTNQVKCHDKKIKRLKGRAKLMASRFRHVNYTWVPRSENTKADKIARG